MKPKAPRNLFASFCVAVSILAAAAPAHAGLLGHWKFDEGTGTTAADSSGNGLTATGGNNWTTGVSGSAAVNPSFTLADSSSLALADGGTAFTISLWANTTTNDDFSNMAGFEGTGSSGDRYSLKVSSGNIQATPGGATASGKIATLSNGSWVHIVAVNDPTAGASYVYINGTQSGAAGSLINLSSTTSQWTMGTYWNSGSYNYTGALDDVQVYDQALSSTEVASLFSNPGFDLFSVPSGSVAMGPPSAGTPTDDGATVESTLLGDDATDVTVVWAYADQGETTIGTWTGAAGGGSYSFGSATENDVMSHAITGLDGDTEYSFRFFATGASSTSWSWAGTLVTGLGDEPAPSDLAATAGENLSVTKVDLTWTDSYTNETGFVIQRSSDSGFTTVDEFAVGPDVTSNTDTTTDPNTTYFYRIAAVGTSGPGPFSAGVEVTTGDLPPEGLLAHWKMDGGIVDDPGPASLVDSSGNGSDLAEDTRFTQGDYAAGVNDTGIIRPRYQAGESLSRDLALESSSRVSLSAWIYLADDNGANDLNNSQGIAGYPGTGSSVDQYGLTTAPGGIIWNYNGDSGFQNVQANFTPAVAGGWYHVVGVYESGVGGTIYVNGPGLGSTVTATGGDVGTLADTKVDAGARFAIGTYANSGIYTSSKLTDEVQLFNTALTASEVASMYADPGSNPLLGKITLFEAAGVSGAIDQAAKTITLEVPFGTDLSTLAPTFTLSSGTCDQTSGVVPTPTFAAAPGNTVDYIVTDTDPDPDVVNTYSVTTTVAPQIATVVINLGDAPGTTIEGGSFIGAGPTNLPLPTLPVGSILQSIVIDASLEATDNGNFANDLTLLFDPTPGTPGDDFSVGITSATANVDFGQTESIEWASGNGLGVPLSETKTNSDWSTPIDLASTGLFLGNAYQDTGWASPDGGTWTGTITLTYEVGGGSSAYSTWSGGELFGADKNGDGVSNGLAFLLGADDPDEDARDRLPTVTENGGGLVLTFSCRDAAARAPAVLNVQWSNDLGVADLWDANEAAVPAPPGGTVNDVVFSVTENGSDDTLDDVIATIPSGKAANGKLFGRLEGAEN